MNDLLARVDAVRGVGWEAKNRGTVTDLTDAVIGRADELATVAAAPLAPVPWDATRDWPKGPRVGLGTYKWKYDPGIIEEALANDVFMIDTAEGYGFGKVETELGKVLYKIPKLKTWIASKVARNHTSQSAVEAAGKRSRDKLRIPKIDLYQIHWPVPDKLAETMDGMAALLDGGVIARVGVSNFCAGHVATAVRLARERGFEVVSNQVRLNQTDAGAADFLVPYCKRLGVKVIAHSPLGQGELRGTPTDSLLWVLKKGVAVAIPASNRREHVRTNLVAGKKFVKGFHPDLAKKPGIEA